MQLEQATLDQIVDELKTRFEHFALTGDLGEEGVYRQWYCKRDAAALVGLVSMLHTSLSLQYLAVEGDIKEDQPWKYGDDDGFDPESN